MVKQAMVVKSCDLLHFIHSILPAVPLSPISKPIKTHGNILQVHSIMVVLVVKETSENNLGTDEFL